MNADNNLHGRGICIDINGTINIGYYKNNWPAPGNFIIIFSNDSIRVGECYFKNAEKCFRGTDYRTDGISKKFGYDS